MTAQRGIAYKLLTTNLTTYDGCQWVVGVKKTTNGVGGLCGPGWLHAYDHAEIAHFLNPIHAGFKHPVLYQVCVGGQCRKDRQLKSGWTEMTLIAPVNAPVPRTEQRIRFAIACALQVCSETKFTQWAYAWLDGSDRSATAATEEWAAMAADSLLRAAQFAMSERVRP